jgi:hypothetical protein
VTSAGWAINAWAGDAGAEVDADTATDGLPEPDASDASDEADSHFDFDHDTGEIAMAPDTGWVQPLLPPIRVGCACHAGGGGADLAVGLSSGITLMAIFLVRRRRRTNDDRGGDTS